MENSGGDPFFFPTADTQVTDRPFGHSNKTTNKCRRRGKERLRPGSRWLCGEHWHKDRSKSETGGGKETALTIFCRN